MRYKGGYKIILWKNELKFFFDGVDNGLKVRWLRIKVGWLKVKWDEVLFMSWLENRF